MPEGIFLSELSNYSNKLFHYYALISGLADRKTQVGVVKRMIENQLKHELSNIRKEFKALLGKKLADYYTIEGQRVGRYKINLGIDLIEYRNTPPLQL